MDQPRKKYVYPAAVAVIVIVIVLGIVALNLHLAGWTVSKVFEKIFPSPCALAFGGARGGPDMPNLMIGCVQAKNEDAQRKYIACIQARMPDTVPMEQLEKKAAEWKPKAEAGDESAQYHYGHLLAFSNLNNPKEGGKWLCEAAKKGNLDATDDYARLKSGSAGEWIYRGQNAFNAATAPDCPRDPGVAERQRPPVDFPEFISGEMDPGCIP